MHKLIIKELGPIQACELEISWNIVLTGRQATGKSTVAKAVYFFRTLKDDVYHLIMRNAYDRKNRDDGNGTEKWESGLCRIFERETRRKFLNTFGASYGMSPEMQLKYFFSEDVFVSISLEMNKNALTYSFVKIEYAQVIDDFLREEKLWRKEDLKASLAKLFDDTYETVYIPAGRSVLTVLGSQFNYFYSMMDDEQKRLLDSYTRNYLERVLALRPHFENGLAGLSEGMEFSLEEEKRQKKARELILKVLGGRYETVAGEERIRLDNGRYVKMNFASSGQQESAWILNLLYYALVMRNPTYFIIEEPESHLFPESQKYIVELIALVINAGHSALITTHSPYVLGEINNLLYAGYVGKFAREKANEIINETEWLDEEKTCAFFAGNGSVNNCFDTELHQIDNAMLDQISEVVNEEYDCLFEIEANVGRE